MTDIGPFDGSEGVQGNAVTTGTQWDNIVGTATFDSTGARAGLGYRWVEASAIAWRGYKGWTANAQVAGRVNFTLNSLPSNNIDLMCVINAAFGFNCRFGINASNKPVIKNAAATVLATGAAAMTAGVLYGAEIQTACGTGAADGTINCQMYALSDPGTLLLSFAATNVSAGSGSQPLRGEVGSNTAQIIDVTFDDILWRTGTLTPVGPVSTGTSPNAAVAASTGAAPQPAASEAPTLATATAGAAAPFTAAGGTVSLTLTSAAPVAGSAAPPGDTAGAVAVGMTIRGS